MLSSSSDGRWSFAGMNSTPIVKIEKDSLEHKLRELGFLHISFYGSSCHGPLFKESFKPLESDWLNVVAKR